MAFMSREREIEEEEKRREEGRAMVVKCVWCRTWHCTPPSSPILPLVSLIICLICLSGPSSRYSLRIFVAFCFLSYVRTVRALRFTLTVSRTYTVRYFLYLSPKHHTFPLPLPACHFFRNVIMDHHSLSVYIKLEIYMKTVKTPKSISCIAVKQR